MKNSKIKSIKAREILDSRGNPTVEVDLVTGQGLFRSQVPSGASKGKYEAVELRDAGQRYHGKGVQIAVRNINKIIQPKLKGKDAINQKEIDDLMIEMDGTKNKSKFGANAMVGVSQACCRAGAAAKNIPLYRHIAQLYENVSRSIKLPIPCFNIVNGGAHAGNELDIQEFMIVSQLKSFREALQIASEIYHELKNIIKEKYIDLAINVGDEGGFAPPVRVPEEALDLILKAAENLGYNKDLKIILDVAASQFYLNGKYKMKIGIFTREGLLRYYKGLIEKYPILGLEDPFAEQDWEAWKIANCKLKIENLLIIGDDLTVTNPKRIKLAEEKKACNAIILKPNQIGTITEAIEAAKLAKGFGWKIMVSHRSGDTCDDFISDLAVGIGADFIKAGAPARGERVAKYNRLLRIEEELHSGS
ncbi:MAG: phosphopyruvate hydratase [Candidatus Nealsonbacteria bacterium CG_4_9_14_0_2_um_filter_37_38]|uniref:Enolase n=1 Tax=Candidatus Nealsonbacteria bacterium CG_4_10_14_0_8_um_filter_37_14 TaxID=1974684 RepID=A0A2M7R688_9BACT|nr:MAG: phosphopyruvate hydratase [Candidatus Nealsonbacteria bacterium CG11_big_fil_rev_8_21_14_0_20_37_68]PIW91930.1 MAG: phosphopyruvate hydratase [Candidatus Nealsonbacteria bacterium CG_4_8_14_3_um_filter_37_23]PIY89079.1 MAG: phosphopyruvate hydratase [Candidatus Nealsonbacteria bacterium CG_4_10_14_0_8_um_filter_37_14]PJC51779.1 MAG: phosphopyruvate hydratase [Candidatus Nealsonbacteria bacterium CG_4_9_14_0_2_um_filter_37_38]